MISGSLLNVELDDDDDDDHRQVIDRFESPSPYLSIDRSIYLFIKISLDANESHWHHPSDC